MIPPVMTNKPLPAMNKTTKHAGTKKNQEERTKNVDEKTRENAAIPAEDVCMRYPSIRNFQTHACHWNKKRKKIKSRNPSDLRNYKTAVLGRKKGIKRRKKNKTYKGMRCAYGCKRQKIDALSAKSGATHK
ncbi:hypothetical protein N7447_003787 [Penicillium robsamsonii]|uniref:uncharacterized protein n=1 Tax=Penicillium robsamsonii TaxID=1792511 RepID=UPI002548EF9D|nr:uncharacterized protein N7447_003787 [Penicillium robsamsonii]KAJ5827024.1 hypothetical protein N7447_003787 [Penicillium robsamsonii]